MILCTFFIIFLFFNSIGAEVRKGGHIRQLIHGWNKNRLKQNKNETQSDLMLATLFQNDDENSISDQQTEGFEQSEEDFDYYYEDQKSYPVGTSFGGDDNAGSDIYYNNTENPEQQNEKPKKSRKKRTFYKPVEEPQRVEILNYVLNHMKSLYPEGQKSGGRPKQSAILAWDKVYELCIR